MSGTFTTFLTPTAATSQLASQMTQGCTTPVQALCRLAKLRSIKAQDGLPIVDYKSDSEGYRQLEFWASPDKTITNRYGDCEDMAMLICAMAQGLPDNLRPSEVRVVVGKADPLVVLPFISGFGMFHSWCEAYIDHIWYIVDGVNGHCGTYPDFRYRHMFGIYPDRIQMFGGVALI